MKKYLITFFVFWIIFPFASSQTLLKMNMTWQEINIEPIDKSIAEELFKEVENSNLLEYRYAQGGCDYRAHMIALILKNKGYETFKIWNFAPSKIFLSENGLLNVKDPNFLEADSTIEWGYHVAPILFVKQEEKIDTIVIDPALFNQIVDYKVWLKIQNNSRSYYTFLKSDYISFLSQKQYIQRDGTKCVSCNDIITGEFYDDQYSLKQGWIEDSIAKGKIFYEYISEKILPLRMEVFSLENKIEKSCDDELLLMQKKQELIEYCEIAEKESNFYKLPKEYIDRKEKYIEDIAAFLAQFIKD